MAKRLIIPKKFALTVAGGTGEIDLDFDVARFPPGRIQGHLTYICITKDSGGGNPKGVVNILDVDESKDIFMDPKPGDPEVKLDFYTYEMRIPVNGAYKLRLDSAPDGEYTVYPVLEERPRSV